MFEHPRSSSPSLTGSAPSLGKTGLPLSKARGVRAAKAICFLPAIIAYQRVHVDRVGTTGCIIQLEAAKWRFAVFQAGFPLLLVKAGWLPA
jgi:hypothetical protein